MARSEKVAAAVALKEAGYKVSATPRGALVEAVATDAPAAAKLDEGDVIVGAGGKPIRTPEELRTSFTGVHPGNDVVLRVRRQGSVETLTVRTVESPSERGRAIIGIRVGQAADIELPLKVDIDLGGVGGPSAGLPFALDVLQELGKDVDHGRRVVATGEIALDGIRRPDRRRQAEDVRRPTRPARTSSSCRLGKTQPRHGAMQGTFASFRCRVFNRRCPLCGRFPSK